MIGRAKAIRLKCLDCCAGNNAEVRRCPAENCPLYPYRMGRTPKGIKGQGADAENEELPANCEDFDGVEENEGG